MTVQYVEPGHGLIGEEGLDVWQNKWKGKAMSTKDSLFGSSSAIEEMKTSIE